MRLTTKTAPRLPFPVASVCFGTSSLGNMPDTYGYDVAEDRALGTIRAMMALEPCFMDTSRNYGMGRSETRIGTVIREQGGLPAEAVLATKLDRDMQTNRLDGDRARRSVEESLEALGLERLQILHLHDPEHCADLSEVTGRGGALEALFRMKEEGLVDAVGLAMGRLDLMTSLLADWEFDALVSHNRYTLMNRAADAMFTDAHARGIAVFNAAPFASGILAKGADSGARAVYQEATDQQRELVRSIERICARHEVPLGAAALQFSMRDTRITSTIVGVSRPERIDETLAWAGHPVPDALWEELAALPFAVDDPEATRVYRPA